MHMGTPIDNQRQAIAANDTYNGKYAEIVL
jgi:hypothetical protein